MASCILCSHLQISERFSKISFPGTCGFSMLRVQTERNFHSLRQFLRAKNCLKGAQQPKIYLLTSDVRSAYRRRNGRVITTLPSPSAGQTAGLPSHPHQSPACQCIIAHLRHAGRAGTPSSELSLARVDHPSAAGAIFGPPGTRRPSSSALTDNSTLSVSTPSGRCREGILNGRRDVFRSSLGPTGRGGGDF